MLTNINSEQQTSMNLRGIKLKNKKSLAGVAVVILVIIAAIGWQAWRGFGDSVDSSVQPLSMNQALSIAMTYDDRGDVEGGLKFYDGQIKGRKDENEKQQLLLYKSDFALKAGKYDEAINAAKQADAIKSNTASMTALARAYEGQGNKQKAAEYYKKLLDAAPKDGMGSRFNSEWEQKLKELES